MKNFLIVILLLIIGSGVYWYVNEVSVTDVDTSLNKSDLDNYKNEFCNLSIKHNPEKYPLIENRNNTVRFGPMITKTFTDPSGSQFVLEKASVYIECRETSEVSENMLESYDSLSEFLTGIDAGTPQKVNGSDYDILGSMILNSTDDFYISTNDKYIPGSKRLGFVIDDKFYKITFSEPDNMKINNNFKINLLN